MPEGKAKSDLVNIGALWKKSKDGETYLSGTFGPAQIFVFPNRYKKKDTEPDYRIMVGARRPKPEKTPTTEEDTSNDSNTPF